MKKGYYCIALLAIIMMACTPATDVVTLTILHTDDTHSQIEPKSNNTSGYARRMGLINQEREADPELLLFDAGDFGQGTPYFNFFKGRIEVQALNRMKYDAITLGNHEFDNGIDTLAQRIKELQCPVVCANYDVEGTALEGLVKPYTILYRKGLKIGVFGLGVDPTGLIGKNNFGGIVYNNPIDVANKVAHTLRKEEKCDVVICLSHLGTEPERQGDIPRDMDVAAHSRNIDVIIGGHQHNIIANLKIANLDGDSVTLAQMGKSGIVMGKMQLTVEK